MYDIDADSLRAAATQAARKVVEQAGTHMEGTATAECQEGKEADKCQEVAANLSQEPFVRWLADRIERSLSRSKVDWLDAKGTVDRARVAALMGEAARTALIGHRDIQRNWLSVGSPNGGSDLLAFDLREPAESLCHGVALVSKPPPGPRFAVVVDANELAKLPVQAVQTLKLSVVMSELAAAHHQPHPHTEED